MSILKKGKNTLASALAVGYFGKKYGNELMSFPKSLDLKNKSTLNVPDLILPKVHAMQDGNSNPLISLQVAADPSLLLQAIGGTVQNQYLDDYAGKLPQEAGLRIPMDIANTMPFKLFDYWGVYDQMRNTPIFTYEVLSSDIHRNRSQNICQGIYFPLLGSALANNYFDTTYGIAHLAAHWNHAVNQYNYLATFATLNTVPCEKPCEVGVWKAAEEFVLWLTGVSDKVIVISGVSTQIKNLVTYDGTEYLSVPTDFFKIILEERRDCNGNRTYNVYSFLIPNRVADGLAQDLSNRMELLPNYLTPISEIEKACGVQFTQNGQVSNHLDNYDNAFHADKFRQRLRELDLLPIENGAGACS